MGVLSRFFVSPSKNWGTFRLPRFPRCFVSGTLIKPEVGRRVYSTNVSVNLIRDWKCGQLYGGQTGEGYVCPRPFPDLTYKSWSVELCIFRSVVYPVA